MQQMQLKHEFLGPTLTALMYMYNKPITVLYYRRFENRENAERCVCSAVRVALPEHRTPAPGASPRTACRAGVGSLGACMLLLLLFSALLPGLTAAAAAATGTTVRQQQPNLIFVMADDLGSNDVGYSDKTVMSPTIDAFVAGGISLTNLYAYVWCAPARASFMTGRYVPMHGFEDSSDGGGKGVNGTGPSPAVPLRFRFLPQTLELAGYSTLMAGKWCASWTECVTGRNLLDSSLTDSCLVSRRHLGYPTPAYTPEARGFHEFLGYLSGAEDYYTHVKTPVPACGDTVDLWRGRSQSNGSVTLSEPASKENYFPQYSIFIFTAFLEQEVAKHAANKPDRPLFIYASYQNVHAPLEVPRRFFDLYKSQGADVAGGADCLWSKQKSSSKHGVAGFACDTDDSVPGIPGTGFRGGACYCNRLIVKAQVSALDEGLRNLTRALQTAGLWNNSVLVFQGDNGGPTFEGHSNTPLRGGKLNFFEGGLRTAGFVNSPLLPTAVAGSTYDGILHTVDWYATFAGLASAPLPAPSDPSLAINGIDAWPALMASRPGLDSSHATIFRAQAADWLEGDAPLRTEALLADGILRVGKWKLVIGGDQKTKGSPFLRDCTIGTDGGWLSPPSDRSSNHNLCPSELYTRSPKGHTGLAENTTLGCTWSWGFHKHGFTRYIGFTNATDAADAWLCGPSEFEGPCTPEHPCLWDVVSDPSERREVAAANPKVVARLMARLTELAKGFAPMNSTTVFPTGGSDFCKAAAARTHGGRQFCGPWYEMPNLPVQSTPLAAA
eukprot:COSAG02_NODE_5897_length_3954_cov_1.799274_3_plen_781_part_00